MSRLTCLLQVGMARVSWQEKWDNEKSSLAVKNPIVYL